MSRGELKDVPSSNLARLLGAVGNRLGEPGPEELDALWQLQLQAPVCVDLPALGADGPVAAPSVTFGEILKQRQSPLDWLRLIKDFAKLHLVHEQGPLPKEIADGLYFAAIAAALNHHQTLITGLNRQKLSRGFEWCLNQPWMDAETKAIIRLAGTQV